MKSKVAFVVPWYGIDIPGGAEAECRELVHLLRQRGYPVEVWTTCVQQFRSDWNIDFHAPGLTLENGVPVHRFPVRKRDYPRFDEVNLKLMYGREVSPAEEEIFFREMIHSPALYGHIRDHGADYLLFFIPYMFGTTIEGTRLHPQRSVLIPCLHEEAYARMKEVYSLFDRVRAIVFHTDEEQGLARQLYNVAPERCHVLGEPVPATWHGNAEAFVRKFALSDFLLYAGRTDRGKNPDLLISYFEAYQRDRDNDLQLVFIGGDELNVPDSVRGRVHFLGRLSEQDKFDCFCASLAMCVPSVQESFSLVMMESWLAGRPAIVNSHCAVTRTMCLRSQGGLYFQSTEEFGEIVDLLRSSPDLASELGKQGGEFVRTHYGPELVGDAYENLITTLSR